MSHFTVLVPAESKEDLENRLLPYHEYECTGIEEFTEFVPADMKELQADYEKHGDGRELDEFAKDWAGYERNDAGILGRVTNPNAKWDWWLVGGRWTGFFKLKDGKLGASGMPGLMTPTNDNPSQADVALAGDIEWAEMQQSQSDQEKALTFAFIDLEGKWNERGRMGWWACVSDLKPDYNAAFWQFIESLPHEQRVYIVDCHI